MMLFDIAPVVNETKANEWYTPRKYVEAARKVMGGIDLDPASCELANRTIKAEKYYTKEENGLAQEWHGRIWLNPPYGRTESYTSSNIGLFTTKLLDEYEQGNVLQAILLSTCRTDSTWFYRLWAYPICFADHWVMFNRPNNLEQTHHIHGTIFVYLGPHEQKFIDIFSEFGTIAKRVSQPKRIIQPPSLWDDIESEE